MDGLTDVMLVCAAVAAVGALVGFAFVRNRDLHESARMDASTDTEPPATTPGEGEQSSENTAVPAARVAGHGQEPAGGSY